MVRLTPQPLIPRFLGNPVTVAGSLNLTIYYPNRTLGQDFNLEQPPLGKVIIGFFVYAFSPNVVSFFWARVPSVIMGAVALVSIYGIGLTIFNEKKWALLSMVFLNFDTLFWIHSRAALLDIYMLAFMMVGIFLYLRNRPYLSMFFLALSTLSKWTGIFGLFIVLIYSLVQREDNLKQWVKQSVINISLCASIVFIMFTVLLQFFGVSHNPFTEIMLYLKWNSSINWTLSLVQGVPSSQPWAWLFNQTPVRYAWLFDPATNLALISFWAQMNPAIIFMAVPVMAYASYDIYKTKSSSSTLILIWFMATWLPYFVISIGGAEQFIHHSLAMLVSVVLGVINWLRTQRKPFIIGYSAFVFAAWLWAYPYPFLILYITGASRYALPPLNFLFGA